MRLIAAIILLFEGALFLALIIYFNQPRSDTLAVVESLILPRLNSHKTVAVFELEGQIIHCSTLLTFNSSNSSNNQATVRFERLTNGNNPTLLFMESFLSQSHIAIAGNSYEAPNFAVVHSKILNEDITFEVSTYQIVKGAVKTYTSKIRGNLGFLRIAYGAQNQLMYIRKHDPHLIRLLLPLGDGLEYQSISGQLGNDPGRIIAFRSLHGE